MMAPDLPLWAAIVVALLLLTGAGFTLLGATGLVRMKDFYERVHPPTLGTTFGTAFTMLSSIVCFSVLYGRPVVHEILIALFIMVTTPVTLMLLTGAALTKDRREGVKSVPPKPPAPEEPPPA